MTHYHYDTLILGGGIAGLWLANRLTAAGYDCLLLEHKALGCDQTLASQGMIHGGVKYALTGALTGASETIADMPAHWRRCLAGQGDVDLSGVPVLSDHFYMWASRSVTARVTTFFASKALRGRVDKVKPDDYPALLKAANQRFDLYKLVDMVLDVPAVIAKLAANLDGRCKHIDWRTARLTQQDGNACIESADFSLSAKRLMLTAGKGNAGLLNQLGIAQPAMQTRPLHQVMVKHQHPFPFQGHCLGADKTPRLTLSSHRALDGDWVWYLGGELAESGVARSASEQIAAAQSELKQLMPWVDLSDAQWQTLPVDRAEPLQPNRLRPDNAFAGRAPGIGNVYVGWPTKLTLAPNLATEMLALLTQDGVVPSHTHTACPALPQAAIAPTPWDLAFGLAQS